MRILILFLALILWAPLAEAAPLRVALLLEHGDASAFTDLLRKGLDAAKGPEIETEVIVAPEGPDQADQFRQAAATHDLVLAATDGMHDILRDNAANYRRVMFGVIDAGIRGPNIMSVTFADEQAAFLAGAAAAMSARGDPPVIGWLSGRDTPAMRSLFSGYSEGALLARPGARIIQAVVGSFADPALAARKAAWLIDSGASVIALAAGSGNEAALAEARSRGVAVIELDAPSGAPALGAIVKGLDRAVEEIISAAASGNLQGKQIITYDLANHGTDFILDQNSGGADINRRVAELRSEIEKGAIRLHSLRQRALCDCLD